MASASIEPNTQALGFDLIAPAEQQLFGLFDRHVLADHTPAADLDEAITNQSDQGTLDFNQNTVFIKKRTQAFFR